MSGEVVPIVPCSRYLSGSRPETVEINIIHLLTEFEVNMCYVGPEDQHDDVDRESVKKCFAIYLLFSLVVCGQHCIASSTSIFGTSQHCTVWVHLNSWTFYYIELYIFLLWGVLYIILILYLSLLIQT